MCYEQVWAQDMAYLILIVMNTAHMMVASLDMRDTVTQRTAAAAAAVVVIAVVVQHTAVAGRTSSCTDVKLPS
jgi:hypothetical protein